MLAIAATAAVAAGCGGGSTSSALQLDPVAAAATKTQNAGAAHVRMNMKISTMGQTLGMSGHGAIDGKSAELSFKLGSMGAAMPTQLKNATIKEIALEQNGDYVVYMQMPTLSAQLPARKAWMKLDLSKYGKAKGIDMSQVMSGNQLKPSDLLAMLKAEGGNVQKVGPATIDGVATTQYRVKIDIAKALESKGMGSNPILKDFASKMKAATDNVWIDKDGLVRRIQFAYGLSGLMRMSMKMDLSDYGTHVTIAAPPSSQVFDMTQLAQQGLGSSH